MTTSKSLPDRPSLESLRKQAKKLARERSLSLRDAQFALAREYGYAGWQDLTAEVSKRLGQGLEWAAAQCERVIHDNDVERLKQLVAAYPALLSWQGNDWDSINTNWNSHEPASLLQHLVFVHRDDEAMHFLIDRGIDMTIKDYRWNSTAAGWARYAMHDETLARWLEEQEGKRKSL